MWKRTVEFKFEPHWSMEIISTICVLNTSFQTLYRLLRDKDEVIC
jgi:hypothetical protein